MNEPLTNTELLERQRRWTGRERVRFTVLAILFVLAWWSLPLLIAYWFAWKRDDTRYWHQWCLGDSAIVFTVVVILAGLTTL